MKVKRKLRILALTALIVGGVSSMATAETITQIVDNGAWEAGTTWSNGVPPADSVDSIVLGISSALSTITLQSDYILGAGQTITQVRGGWFNFNSGTLDIFGSVNFVGGRHFSGGTSAAKTLILQPGSEFNLGAGYRVANSNFTTKWIANSTGVTDIKASYAQLTGSAAVIDLTDYDLAGSGSNVVLMTTAEELGHTFASVTLIAPSNLTYVADVDYAYNNNTQIALTNIAVWTPPTNTSFLALDPSELEMTLVKPATLVTGSVDLVYTSHTNVNLTVTISTESHPGSFSVLSTNPQVLDPAGFKTTVPVTFQFDNSVAALNNNQTATGLVTFAWSDEGGGDSGSFTMPISVLNPAATQLIGRWLAGTMDYADKSGYTPAGTHDGTIVGTGTGFYFTNDVPGLATGSSLYLANTNCLVIGNTRTSDSGYVNTFDEGTSQRFSVSFWAKGYPATGATWLPTFISKGGETGKGWQIRRRSSMAPVFTLRGPLGAADPASTINVTSTNWHHYAATWDGSAGIRRLYIDGVLSLDMSGDTGTMGLPNNSHLVIGAREANGAAPSSHVNGVSFFDVRMYNAALSQSEVLSVINDSSPFTPTLSIATVANQVVVTWDVGTLLETTSLQYGGWTTNSAAVSPYQVDPATPVKFFKVQNP
jgi:hypothetical protein